MHIGLRLLILVLAIAVLVTDGAPSAFAGDGLIYELKVGALDHDVANLWSGFRREKESLDINIDAQLSPSMQLFFGTLRPAVGGTINTEGLTSIGYVDARWTIESASGLFFALGLGAAVHDGNIGREDPTRKALGSRVLFHIPLEFGYRFDAHNSISAYFEHTSNAYTQTYNEGMDRLGVRYGYRF